MHPFDLVRARTLPEATSAFSGDAAYLAGGHTLIPAMKSRLRQVETLIDLSAISGLADIREQDGRLLIGAMARHAAVAESALVRQQIPALAKLAGGIGDPQVRNRGTLGGSIANNDSAADYPAAVLALDATIETTNGRHAADDFFQGMFQTALAEGELITAVSFRIPDSAAYEKQRHPASRYPMAGVFIARFGPEFRVTVTGATNSVQRWAEAESALQSGQSLDDLSLDSPELATDIHASAEYRGHLAGVMLRRAASQL